MAFLCPVRIRRNKKKHGIESDLISGTLSRHPHHQQHHHHPLPPGRITGSASIETLVRVGIEKEHGLSPDSKMVVLHDFTPYVDDELEVHRGQIVNVLYQENDWVYVIAENQQEGFIPFSYCAPYDSQTTNMLTIKKKMPRGPNSLVSGIVEQTTTAVVDSSKSVNQNATTNDYDYDAEKYNTFIIKDHYSEGHFRKNYLENFEFLAEDSQNASNGQTGGGTESAVEASVMSGRSGNQVSKTNQSMLQSIFFNKPFGKPLRMTAILKDQKRVVLGEVHPFFKELLGRHVVIFSYVARQEDDINVERGEIITVLNRDDPDWCWVVRFNAQEGFMPSSYLRSVDTIYHATEANAFLNQLGPALPPIMVNGILTDPKAYICNAGRNLEDPKAFFASHGCHLFKPYQSSYKLPK